MKTIQFLKDYLQDFARVTLCNEKGSIFYTGDVASIPYAIIKNTKIVSIEGLGSENDLIITIE